MAESADSDFALALSLENEWNAEPECSKKPGLSGSCINNKMAAIADADYSLALSLEERWNAQTVSTEKNVMRTDPSRPLCIIDESWEVLDPNPEIRSLFMEFNTTFFWGKLDCVEVKWSPRMTYCAGLCCYEGRNGLCSVRLSLPLLKLRSRRDLVETLLHEMIHAYLFVTFNNKDHDDHGPEFCKHMARINKDSGTNITIYHNYTDEVDFYRTHWWKCDGPCQKAHPYFGMVKRATNRAPGPNDRWWTQHQQSCGGTYTKVKEPDNYKPSKRKNKESCAETLNQKKPRESIIPFFGKGHSVGECSGKETKIGKHLSDLKRKVGTIGNTEPQLLGPVGRNEATAVATGTAMATTVATAAPISSNSIINGVLMPRKASTNLGDSSLSPSKKVVKTHDGLFTNGFKPFAGTGNVLGGKTGLSTLSKPVVGKWKHTATLKGTKSANNYVNRARVVNSLVFATSHELKSRGKSNSGSSSSATEKKRSIMDYYFNVTESPLKERNAIKIEESPEKSSPQPQLFKTSHLQNTHVKSDSPSNTTGKKETIIDSYFNAKLSPPKQRNIANIDNSYVSRFPGKNLHKVTARSKSSSPLKGPKTSVSKSLGRNLPKKNLAGIRQTTLKYFVVEESAGPRPEVRPIKSSKNFMSHSANQ